MSRAFCLGGFCPRTIYGEDASGETRTRNPWSLTIGILTINFSTGTRSFCVL